MSLSAKGISVLRRGKSLLGDVSVDLGESGSIAIIGPNGAGKSTLLKCLTGLIAPTSGEILLNGRPLESVPAADRAQAIGYMPQHFSPHWDMPVQDLMMISMERCGGHAGASAIEAQLASHGLSKFSKRWWSTLSGGERARTLLAMVLATKPSILLADEPTASLDIRHKLDVTKRLVAYGASAPTAVVVHDLDVALNCYDRVILLSDGRVEADCEARALIHDQLIDQVYGVPFKRVIGGDHILLRPVDVAG